MSPEMAAAIEKFIRERLQIRLELDRGADYDGRYIEVTAKLVLITCDEPGPFTTYSEAEITKDTSRLWMPRP